MGSGGWLFRWRATLFWACYRGFGQRALIPATRSGSPGGENGACLYCVYVFQIYLIEHRSAEFSIQFFKELMDSLSICLIICCAENMATTAVDILYQFFAVGKVVRGGPSRKM